MHGAASSGESSQTQWPAAEQQGIVAVQWRSASPQGLQHCHFWLCPPSAVASGVGPCQGLRLLKVHGQRCWRKDLDRCQLRPDAVTCGARLEHIAVLLDSSCDSFCFALAKAPWSARAGKLCSGHSRWRRGLGARLWLGLASPRPVRNREMSLLVSLPMCHYY